MSEEWKSLAQRFADMQRQLAEVTRERDQYKAAYEIQQQAANKGDSNEH